MSEERDFLPDRLKGQADFLDEGWIKNGFIPKVRLSVLQKGDVRKILSGALKQVGSGVGQERRDSVSLAGIGIRAVEGLVRIGRSSQLPERLFPRIAWGRQEAYFQQEEEFSGEDGAMGGGVPMGEFVKQGFGETLSGAGEIDLSESKVGGFVKGVGRTTWRAARGAAKGAWNTARWVAGKVARGAAMAAAASGGGETVAASQLMESIGKARAKKRELPAGKRPEDLGNFLAGENVVEGEFKEL